MMIFTSLSWIDTDDGFHNISHTDRCNLFCAFLFYLEFIFIHFHFPDLFFVVFFLFFSVFFFAGEFYKTGHRQIESDCKRWEGSYKNGVKNREDV